MFTTPDDPPLPRVSLITLGGTIASTSATKRESKRVAPTLRAEQQSQSLGADAQRVAVVTRTLRTLPSSDLTLDDVTELATVIDDEFQRGSVGIIVTQGTDSLEEVAFALSLLVEPRGPIVLTGAMRNPEARSADGPANLAAGLSMATAEAPPGVYVVVNDEIHDPYYVRKAHTTSLNAFVSAPAGLLGWVSEGRVHLTGRVRQQEKIRLPASPEFPELGVVTAFLGQSPSSLRAILTAPIRALLIDGFGGGHVPASWMADIRQALERLPVVLCSRTGVGPVLENTYDFAGSEVDLVAAGAWPSGNLDARKARIALSLLIAAGREHDQLRDDFHAIAKDSLLVRTLSSQRPTNDTPKEAP